MGKKIAILGTASHRCQAPFDDSAWQIWACADPTEGTRWDRWFELHSRDVIEHQDNTVMRVFLQEALAAKHGVVYMAPDNVWPGAVPYPLTEVVARYSDWFLTSTIAYMLGVALLEVERGDTIGLWGVDMASTAEYQAQKPGCQFFIQLARMHGVNIQMPRECELLVPGKLYGMESDRAKWLRMKVSARSTELENRILGLDNALSEINTKKLLIKGCLEVKLAPELARQALAELDVHHRAFQEEWMVLNGALQDQRHVADNWI